MTLDAHLPPTFLADPDGLARTEPLRSPFEPALIGRRAQLRPTGPADYDFLFGLDWPADRIAFGRFRGSTPSPELFISSIWNGVAATFIVEQLPEARPVGVVIIYNLDTRNGHAAISLASDRTRAGGLTVMEGAALVIDYAFRIWPLHKLYAEVLESNLPQFRAATRSLFAVEARLGGDVWYDDQRWDKFILALYRERWDQARAGYFRLIVGEPTDDPLASRANDLP